MHHNAHGRPTWIKGLNFIPERPAPRNRIAFIGCAALLHLHRKKKLDVHSVSLGEVNAALMLAGLGSRLKLAPTKDTKDPHKDPDPHKITKDPPCSFLNISMNFCTFSRRGKHRSYRPTAHMTTRSR